MTDYNEKDNLIERTLRKIIAVVVIIALMIPLIAPEVFAASSVIISGGDNVKGGDTFTIAVTFDGGDIGRVDAQMTYDTNKLTYISGGTSSGNTGYIQLKTAGTEGSIVFNIEFQAVSEGDADLEVTTNEMYDLNEMMMDTPSASKTVTISGDAEEEALITETASPEEPVEATELIGIDEKAEEEETTETATNLNIIFIAVAVVLVLLIVIVSIILVKKRKKKALPPTSPMPSGRNETPYEDPREQNGFMDRQRKEDTLYVPTRESSYDHDGSYGNPRQEEGPRVGRSGKILDTYADDDDAWLDELMSGGNDGYRSRENERNQDVRKRANEETELWREWDLNSKSDPDDLEKW